MQDRDMEQLSEPTAGLDRLVRAVLAVAVEVHKHLGPGYLESVYNVPVLLRGVKRIIRSHG